MRKRDLVLAAACATVLVNGTLKAAVTVDGSYDADYGTALAVQTNNSGFGDSTTGSGSSENGSELDAAYAIVQGGSLHILLTGNLQAGGNFNHIDLFLSDGRPGQSVIKAATGGSNLNTMNGSKFSPGFNATYALDINTSATQTFVNYYDMTQGTAPSTNIGPFTPNNGISNTLTNGVAISFNNTNAAGVVGGAPSAADPVAAQAVTTGLEISIPLSQLGGASGGSIEMLADINGGGNSFLSNQFLTGLGSLTGNLGGGGKFDFSGTAGQFFSVMVPAAGGTNGVWANTAGGSWVTPTNWTGGVPQVAGDSANFGSAITNDATVTLDGSKTVGKITFNNAHSYTIDVGTGGSLTIDDSTDTIGNNPAINVQLGSHTILAPVSLASGVTINTLDSTSLTLKGAVSGSGDISHTGAGTLVLASANTFSGNLTSTAGTVELDDANAASGGVITLGDANVDNLPAALNIGSAITSFSSPIVTNRDLASNNDLRIVASAGNLTLSSDISLNGGVVFAPATGTTVTVSGLLHDGTDSSSNARRAVHASGAGTVVITNQNTNSGDTFVDSGTLILAHNASLNSGSVNVFTGGNFVDNGLLPSTVKIYTRGNVFIPGNTDPVSALPLQVGTLQIDDVGSMVIGHSAATAAPVQVSTGDLTFLHNITGKLDLTNNQLSTSDDQDTIRGYLAGGNLLTSTAGGTLGYKDNGSGGTQIQFAIAGDADLSGTVTSSDFDTLAAHFGETTDVADDHWTEGDFNYDGIVNTLDFNAIASNFGKSVPVSAPIANAMSLVPEPSTLSLLGFAAAGLMRRRSSRRK